MARPLPRSVRDARLLAGVFACGLLLALGVASGQDLKAAPELPARREGIPEPARGYQIERCPEFTLESAPGGESTAKRVKAFFPRARREVEAALGRGLPAQPHVIVAPTDSEFVRRYARLAGEPPPRTVLAVALPGRDLVIVRASGVVEGTNAGLEATLRHELGHLVLGELERARGEPLPRWLNEGLCEVAAGRTLTDQEQTSLASWAKFNEIPSLDDYARGFPRHGSEGPRAYTISFAFMAWLGEKAPPPKLLDALAKQRVNEAFREVYGDLPGELHLDWLGKLSSEQSVFKSLLYSLNVWSVAALLAILAGLRAYAQRRKLSAQLAAEEERQAPRLEAAWTHALEKIASGFPYVLCPECKRGALRGDPPRCESCGMGPPAPAPAPAEESS